MQHFKPRDAVLIIPKYAHLYGDRSGFVISAKADPFRPMFNEYTLQLADRSTARLFEFQIIEDAPECNTAVAAVIFDSQYDSPPIHTRGQPSSRQVILETPAFHIDMRIRTTESRGSIMGQILERGTKNQLENLEVLLMREAIPISRTTSDSIGVFEFTDAARGSFNILVKLPQHFSRIFGTFSI